MDRIERAGGFEGEQFEMTFPTAAMDDVLKSLVIEGSLRQRYVSIISESEERLATLQSSDDSLAAEYATVESDTNTQLDALSSGTAD